MKNLFTLILFSVLSVPAQELSRRAFLGIQMVPVNEDTKRIMGLPSVKGVLIENVIPGSTAEKAGFKKGDVLLTLNQVEINAPADAVRLVGSLVGGADLTYELIREKKPLNGKTNVAPLPFEKHEGIEMEYTAVQTKNGLQRLIISKPPGKGKHPVIVFIGGIGCYSLDFPFEKERSEVLLLNELTRAGYVCVRAEKPGVGDNRKCTPCEKVSFMDEVSGYNSAVREVKKMSYVDSNSVFIFGHSMGGVMAPVMARTEHVKGIVAYGTIGSNFIEYLAKTRRTVAKAYNMPPDETDTYIKDYCECAALYFVDGLTTDQAAQKKEDCREYLSIFDLRSSAYNKELYALNIPAEWKSFKGNALLLYGDQDFVASENDHQIVTETINHFHPGHAQIRVIKNAAHGMTGAASYVEARETVGRYNEEVGKVVLEWLKKVG